MKYITKRNITWLFLKGTGDSKRGGFIEGEQTYEIEDILLKSKKRERKRSIYCRTPVLGLGLGVDFTLIGNKEQEQQEEPSPKFSGIEQY